MITEITNKNRLEVIKTFAELGNIELVLREAEALAYGRSYAHICDNELKKEIDSLYKMVYELEEKVANLTKQLD